MKHTKTSLIILAAGTGTRYKNGIKQLEKVGPSGEILMAYSIYDALLAGFDEVIVVIRKELLEAFQSALGASLINGGKLRFIAQDTRRFLGGLTAAAKRQKPWGTAHSLLCAMEGMDAPFAVINADDHYGKEAFSMLHTWLVNAAPLSPDGRHNMALVSYVLGNTLSDFGGVTRGVCTFNSLGTLTKICETRNILRTKNSHVCESADGLLSAEAQVSMNMWGMFPEIFGRLEEAFHRFLAKTEDPENDEFVLPIVINGLLTARTVDVAVLRSVEPWFGMTYREDAARAAAELKKRTESGRYRTPLF